MSQYDDYKASNFTLRSGIDKILKSIGKSKSEEIKNILGDNNLDINYCYDHPDILCRILRMIYGRSYIEIMESI